MYAGRIYADFQDLDDANRIRLVCVGTHSDLRASELELREGAIVPLYTDDADESGHPDPLLADGIIEYNSVEQCWVARVNWQFLRHASDQLAAPSPAESGFDVPPCVLKSAEA